MLYQIEILLLLQIVVYINGIHLNVRPTIDEKCLELRDNFANASAAFILCSIDSSRPITLCEKCITHYMELRTSFGNMSQVDSNGTKCIDHFINLDRLQIVEQLYLSSVDLWNKAKCSECFDGDQPYHESNITKKFLEHYNDFSNCIDNIPSDDEMCHHCMDYYISLDTYYKHISNINEEIGICIDIVDKMNTTWSFWSPRCCKFRRHDEYIFIGSSLAVLLTTVCFYLFTLFLKEKRAPTIVQQSRFAESFVRS